VKLHVLSDLHLSVASFEAPHTNADVVVLAGDIARPKEAIAWASQLAKPVLYVAGNHEFYGGSLSSTIRELKQLCDGSDIHVLDNDEMVIGGVRFLGTTLWTDFLLFGDGHERDVAIRVAMDFVHDFIRIRMDEVSSTCFTPSDSALLFSRNAKWLETKLAEPFHGSTVVITHHAPSPKSIHSRFMESPLNACFVSNAEWLLDGSRVALWIHGHTHDSFEYVLKGTRVICNPRGYARNGVNENARFDPNLVLEVAEGIANRGKDA